LADFDTDAARQALEAAFDTDAGVTPAPEQATTPTAPVASEVESAQRATEPDTFTNVDPSTLAPELQAIYKQMQGDYTRKTQEVSARAREIAAFGDPTEVRNAVEFANALRDPQNLVQLHSELSEYLQSQGLTPAQADAAATQEIQGAQSEYGWEFSDPDDDIRRELQELRSQNQELQNWRQEQEEQRMFASIEQDVARKEAFIRQNNPTYQEEDINSIYVMSYAFGGDLLEAQRAYEAQRQRFAAEYMNSKANVPSSLGPIAPSGGAEAPQTFGRDLDAAHDYAKARAIAELNQFGG
jgi:hypothetical protein